MRKLLLFTFFFLFSLFIHAQTNNYVAQNGNNGNNGTEASPWLTIQYGVNQLAPGDILYIKAGTYEEKIDIDVSGTATETITIRNYPGDDVIISGANSNNNNSIIWTDNAYLRIEGLHITDSQKNYSAGITLQGTAHHIEVINNKISKINFSSDPNATVGNNTNSVPVSALGDAAVGAGGIPDSVHHISFIGNEVFDNRTGYSENLTMGGNVSHFLMENNIVHDNTNIAIDATGNYGESPVPAYDHVRYGTIKNNILYNNTSPYSPAAGIYIDGGKNIVVENNLSYNNGYGGEIGCEEDGETSNIIFRNNVFHHNSSAGMHFGGYDVNTTGKVVNSQVYNNTFYQNDTDGHENGSFILTKSENCKIFNNIFYINAQNVFLYAYRTQTNLYFDYNLVFSANGDQTTIETTVDGDNNGGTAYTGLLAFYAATGYGTNSLYGDPLFTNAVSNDFHIAANSPAVNAGDPTHTPDPVEVDLDGAARTVQAVDMGVDEYATPLPVEYLSPFQGFFTKNGILLHWATSEEINADQYIIQRLSTDNHWKDLQSISAGKVEYRSLDRAPINGINIYRLKQMDLDGQFSYSNLVSIVWRLQKEIQLFPNPSHGILHFSDHQAHRVEVRNYLGQVIYFAEATNQIYLAEKGVYFVTIFDNQHRVLGQSSLVID